ncbi:MAG: tRNA dihydrouridine synthase [Desulfopila sp.]
MTARAAGGGDGFLLRNTAIATPLALAPMVGLSHSAMRSLVLELGGIGLLFTEMLSARGLPHDNARISPLLARSAAERPLIYQIFLADEQPIDAAVARLESLDADGIDLNLGCPAPQLRRCGSGGFLAEDRQLVDRIVTRIRRATTLPISAKIRLGRTLDKPKLIGFSRMLADAGVDMLTVHGRLHGEKFCRPARWEWISHVKQAVSVPVLANGGIFSVADARRCLEQSGADGLMLGRGACIRPWLAAEIAAAVYKRPVTGRTWGLDQIYFRFVELLGERFQPERQLGRLKQFSQYYARSFTFGHQLASLVQTSNTMAEAVVRARDFFSGTEECEHPVEL